MDETSLADALSPPMSGRLKGSGKGIIFHRAGCIFFLSSFNSKPLHIDWDGIGWDGSWQGVVGLEVRGLSWVGAGIS